MNWIHNVCRRACDYVVSLRLRTGSDQGRFQTLFDNTTALGLEIDGYSATAGFVTVTLGAVAMPGNGRHAIGRWPLCRLCHQGRWQRRLLG